MKTRYEVETRLRKLEAHRKCMVSQGLARVEYGDTCGISELRWVLSDDPEKEK